MKLPEKFFVLTSTLIFVAVLWQPGCNKSPEKSIVGKWELDKDAILQKGLDRGRSKEEFDKLFGDRTLTYEYSEDGNVKLFSQRDGKSDNQEGTWEIVDKDSQKILVITMGRSVEFFYGISFNGSNKLQMSATKGFDIEDVEVIDDDPLMFKRVK